MKESLDISKDNLQDAAKSCNNCNEPNMKEILLIKCDTTIYADEITNLLIEITLFLASMMRDKIKGQVLMVQLQVLRYMFMRKIMKRLLR